MIICTRCGADNPDGQRFCNNCQAALPQIPKATTMARTPDKVMERYYQLKEASDKVQSKEWSMDEFAEFLESIAVVLAEKEQQIREIEIPDETYDDFAEELDVGFQGIELYNEGIAHMMLYLEDENPEHLEEGLQLVLDGNDCINNAMRINRENRRKLEEMYVDTSTLM